MLFTQNYNRRKIVLVFLVIALVVLFLIGRLSYLMLKKSAYYSEIALQLHQREREIKAARGEIYDRNGVLLASNKTVCTISVIHSQITDEERVIQVLADALSMDEADIRKKVTKVSAREKIKSNVPIEVGNKIRNLHLNGVKVDEDYKRYYLYDSLASKVLGFTGGENQGIVGVEVKYDHLLQGKSGNILTMTDARGVELEKEAETREEPVAGKDLYLTLDYNIQCYADQAARKTMEQKSAEAVEIIVMNPQNGEILAMVNQPEYNLNEPFSIFAGYEHAGVSTTEKQNAMWRNACISDTYEPGSTFKIITAAAALESGVVSVDDSFYCPGYIMVGDRRIRCHKTTGHGSEDFTHGIMNSCKQVFIDRSMFWMV